MNSISKVYMMMWKIISGKSKGCFEFKIKEVRLKCAEESIAFGTRLMMAGFITMIMLIIKEEIELGLIIFVIVGMLGWIIHYLGLIELEKVYQMIKN